MKKSGYRKIAAFVLVVVLVLTTATSVVFANSSTTGKIDGFNEDVKRKEHGSLEALYSLGLGHSGSTLNTGLISDVQVEPGDEIRIPLTADLFTWDDERMPLAKQKITVGELKRGRVTVRTQIQSGADTLDYVQFDTDTFSNMKFATDYANVKTNKTAYISIKFAPTLKSVEPVDFIYDIYLAIDGEIQDDLFVSVSGTLANKEVDIYNNDFVDITDNYVAIADDFKENVTFDLGSGVTITRNVFNNRKYFGNVKISEASEIGFTEAWPEVYPSVVAAYQLETINFRYGFSKVKIDPTKVIDTENSPSKYHVYGEDMTYYGSTDEELPYADVYFLSTEYIDTFEREDYLDKLENAPVSRRVAVNENQEIDIDEAPLVAKERVEKEKQINADYEADVVFQSKQYYAPGEMTDDVPVKVINGMEVVEENKNTENDKIQIINGVDSTASNKQSEGIKILDGRVN